MVTKDMKYYQDVIKTVSFTTAFSWNDFVGSTKLTEGFGVDIPQLKLYTQILNIGSISSNFLYPQQNQYFCKP